MLGFFLALALVLVSFAQEIKDSHMVLELSAEEWVRVEKVRVGIGFEIAGREDEINRLRREVPNTLKSLSQQEWFITSYSVFQDHSGLTRLSLVAQTHLPETELYGLYDKVKRLSKAGYAVRVAFVDYSPSVSDRERALATAREKIYRMAQEEAKRVSRELGKNYMVYSVNFTSKPIPTAEERTIKAMSVREEEAPSLPRAEKVLVRALVILKGE